MRTSIKICGLNDAAAVHAVAEAGADLAGFVFFPPSPRHIEFTEAANLKALLPATIQAVSVLVDPNDALLQDVARALNPAWVQLHGKEQPERLRQLRQLFPQLKLIKAISVRDAADLDQARAYHDVADLIMFDAKAPAASTLPGGNGVSFDWNLLKDKTLPAQWMLSGGLNCQNVQEALRISHAPMIDVSSGVESQPGVKDPALIHAFVKAVRNV